ncbi:hypothetical protein [Sphingomonas morindae]|uniref:Uncharacterized protein n=1 Tax=Sphingomonas morindae TaxID=1541170 RepID=A0ABY4XBA5_9SPHN|nr:hypothetical protein [Sphingomonas morindae]USI74260.1 hypothetical protein LHA26_07355 [Sphingomonas morindae]
MDDLLRKALERRSQLRAELEALDRLIHTYARIQEGQINFDMGDTLFPVGRAGRSRAEQSAQLSTLLDDARGLIVEAGRPLTRSQLVAGLEAAGHRLDGTDKVKVLGTNIWRSRRFWNLKGAGYWPKDLPVPDEFLALTRRETSL